MKDFGFYLFSWRITPFCRAGPPHLFRWWHGKSAGRAARGLSWVCSLPAVLVRGVADHCGASGQTTTIGLQPEEFVNQSSFRQIIVTFVLLTEGNTELMWVGGLPSDPRCLDRYRQRFRHSSTKSISTAGAILARALGLFGRQ